MDDFGTLDHLSVAPIVVNAGAAILPALVAGLASVATALIKKPWLLLIVAAVGVGLWFGVGAIFEAATASGGRKRSDVETGPGQGVATNWADVAKQMIRMRQFGSDSGGSVAAKPLEQVKLNSPVVFRTDMTRCGYDGGVAPRGLKLKWVYQEKDTMFLSSPVVVGGKVFGASCYMDTPTSWGSLFCLDAENGRIIWRKDQIAKEDLKSFFSSPAITQDGKYLIIGQGLHPDSDCNLYCLSTATGRLHWKHKIDLHIESSPVIYGDMVIVGAGAIEDIKTHKPTSHPGYVFAVRISDGKMLWKHDVVDPESSPAAEEGMVYIGSGFNGHAVVALRTLSDEELKKDGLKREKWKTKTDYPATGAITLVDDLVLAGVGNGDFVFKASDPAGVVMALDKETGAVRWTAKFKGSVLGAVAARDGIVICPTGAGEIVALKQKDGKEIWRTKVRENTRILAAPAFTGDLVYAVTKDGYLVVLDAKDGKVLEQHYVNEVGNPGDQAFSISSPTVAGGRVFLGSETGGVRCYVGSSQE